MDSQSLRELGDRYPGQVVYAAAAPRTAVVLAGTGRLDRGNGLEVVDAADLERILWALLRWAPTDIAILGFPDEALPADAVTDAVLVGHRLTLVA